MMLMMNAVPLEVTGVIRRDTPGVLRIEITGDVDDYTAPALRDVLDLPLAEHPARLDLDLSGVTYFSCAGLRVLLAVRQVTDQLRLLGAGPPVRRILDAVGLGLTLVRTDVGRR